MIIFSIIIKILISFLIKLLYDLPMMVLGWFIVPIAILFEKNDQLPIWAWPWGNKDHGNDGDAFYDKVYDGVIGNPTTFWQKYTWLAFRNPTFNSSKYFISFIASGTQTTIGNRNVARDREAGYFYTKDRWAWDIQLVKKYRFNHKKCFHFRCGWKLNRKSFGEHCQFVFMISPYKTYSGI